MKKTFVLCVVAVLVASFAVCGVSSAAKKVKVKGGFAWHPLQQPVSMTTVKANWTRLMKGKKDWKLYTLKNITYNHGGSMTILLQDDTGLDVQTTLTQPQWLGFMSACVETTQGVMIGVHETAGEIVAFAAPVSN